MLSRVVPAISVTILRSSPMNEFISEDLPAFGRPTMVNLGISSSSYWGFMEITDKQFDGIIKKGEIYENIIVD